MPRDVFVSYSQPDHDCAVELVEHIESHGISTWIAPRDVSPAADWAAEIIDALSAARVMVLVFSASSNDSAQVRREVERAVHKQLRILPFRIEDVVPSKSLEYFLSAQHWLDAFPPPRAPHYERLCAFLQTALRAQAARVPPPVNAADVVAAAAPLAAVNAAQLQQLDIELARYIGPVAKILVRRAAADASDFEHLVLRLATELDSDHERRQFIDTCRQLGRFRS
jgi:predicted nuclease with RNAse H fold